MPEPILQTEIGKSWVDYIRNGCKGLDGHTGDLCIHIANYFLRPKGRYLTLVSMADLLRKERKGGDHCSGVLNYGRRRGGREVVMDIGVFMELCSYWGGRLFAIDSGEGDDAPMALFCARGRRYWGL